VIQIDINYKERGVNDELCVFSLFVWIQKMCTAVCCQASPAHT